jgi:transposase
MVLARNHKRRLIMTTKLDNLFEIEGLKDIDFSTEANRTVVTGSLQNERQSCPRCGGSHVTFNGKVERKFHLPPVGSKKTVLRLLVRRNLCNDCKRSWWPSMPFAKGKQRMSTSFVNHVLDLLKMGTISDVARHLGLTWDTVKDVHKSFLQEEYPEIDISEVKYLTIDEFSIAKRHKYMTVVADLKTGRIIHAVEGRKKKI